MRYLAGCTLVLVALMALPLSVSAQADEEAETSEPSLQEAAPSSEAADDEGGLSPGLRKRTRKKWDPGTYNVPSSKPDPVLKLGESSLEITPNAPTGSELRVREARNGLIGSAIVLAIGGGIVAGTMVATRNYECGDWELFCVNGGRVAGVTVGSLVMLGGVVAMGVSGGKLSARKQELRNLQKAKNRRSHHVEWDLARSRLVF
jgi:hypothetical protein